MNLIFSAFVCIRVLFCCVCVVCSLVVLGCSQMAKGREKLCMAETLWWPSIALDFVKRVAARDSAFANDYQLINFFFFLASMVVVVVDLKGT